MRIVLVAPEVFPVPPIRGGAIESIIQEVASRLTNDEVHVFCVADPDLPLFEKKGHVTYWRYQQTFLDRVLLFSYKLPFKQSTSPLYYRFYANWIARHVKQLKPDVIHVMSRFHFVLPLLKARPKAAVVFSLHQLSDLSYGNKVWSRQAINACDIITGCSQFMTDEFVRQYPMTLGKARVLFNGINAVQFRPWWERSEDRCRVRGELGIGKEIAVLFCGRLVEQKGVHVLADAFSKIAAKHPNTYLIIAGSHGYSDNSETPYIRALKAMLSSCAERVKWLGYVSRERMADVYAGADLVVLPSASPESFSLVTLEAALSGLPVISFAHGGPLELIKEKETGLLIPLEQGAIGLTNAIETLLNNPDLRIRMGKNAQLNAKSRFDWSLIMPQTEKLYAHAIARHRNKIFIAESGSGYGGTGRYLFDLVHALDGNRFAVQVVAYAHGPFINRLLKENYPLQLKPGWRFLWAENVRDAGQTTKRSFPGKLLTWTLRKMGSILQIIFYVPLIALYLRKQKCRLVHLNNEILTHIPLILAARLAGCKSVCHLHGWRPFTKIEKLVVQYVDELICISEAGSRYFSDLLNGRCVQAIPNGVNINGRSTQLTEKRTAKHRVFGLSDEQTAVVILGRLVPWKGQDVFLKAMQQVISEKPNSVGLIVGEDSSRDKAFVKKLKDLSVELAISDNIKFAGWQDDVEAIYAGADIVVHASTKPEPFGLVILEAMLAGKPVVAVEGGGVNDLVINGETGLLVKSAEEKEIAHAIMTYINNHDLVHRFTTNAYNRLLTHFTIERNATEIMALYDKLLENSKKTYEKK